MKLFAIVPLLTTTALAASSLSGTSSSSGSSLIPSGISEGCQTFLINLNSDTAVAACLASITSATSAYGPSSASTPSSSTITTSLGTLCSSSVSNSCSKSMFSGQLASFKQACSDELVTNPVAAVLQIYDELYTINPFLGAICCKDDSGQYCVTKSTTSSNTTGSQNGTGAVDIVVGSKNGDLQKYLWSPVPSNTLNRRDSTAVAPNMTTFASFNIAFLLLQPNVTESALCTTCTRNIITSYIGFETDVPYASVLAQSTLLGGQPDLYNAVQSKCGSNFLSGAVQAAGGIAGGLLSGAPKSVGGDFKSTIAVMLGIVGLGFTAVL